MRWTPKGNIFKKRRTTLELLGMASKKICHTHINTS